MQNGGRHPGAFMGARADGAHGDVHSLQKLTSDGTKDEAL